MLGSKGKKGKGSTLKGMKSKMTYFDVKAKGKGSKTVDGGTRNKVGENRSIQSGRVDT